MPKIKQFITVRFPALASRDFLIFWVGQFVSLIGTWMQSTTLPYLAYRLTNSSFDLGLIGFASSLPLLFIALPVGVIIERLDKRRTVIIMQAIMMIQAFTLAVLALTGVIKVNHIIGLAFILGIANAIEITARQAMLVELVGKPALPNAIALQSTIFNAARVIGPALTGIVLIFVQNQGEGWAFMINGLSFVFVIIGLFFVRTPYRVEVDPSSERNLRGEFAEGMRYIFDTPTVSLLILMAAVLGLFAFPFAQQIPAIARSVLHQATDVEATVQTRTSSLYLFQGVGALVAAAFLSAFSGLRNKGRLMSIGQFTFIIGVTVMSAVKSLPAALVIITFMGWGTVTQLAMMNILIQLQVPDNLRGRVFSVYLWGLQGVGPFGSLLIGWMAQTWSVPTTALVCGLICLVTVGGIQFLNPTLRKLSI